MFCPYCGEKNEEGSSFCQRCGKPLPVKPDQAPAETVQPKNDSPDKSPVQFSQPYASSINIEPADGIVCSRCHFPNSLPVKEYCQSCGYPLGGANPIRPIEGAQKYEQADISPTAKKPSMLTTFLPRIFVLFRKRTTLILIGVAVMALVIGGIMVRQGQDRSQAFSTADVCQPLTPDKDFEEANAHDLNGDLKRDSYFRSGQDYAIAENGTLRVPDGITLIIEPGARIRFGRGAKMIVNGELSACGRNNRRILFTADADTGQPGFWGGIEFSGADKNSVIGHATFEFAGNNYQPVIQIDRGSINLEDLKFDSNQYYSLSFAPDSLPGFRPPITIDNGPQGWEMHSGKLEDDLTWDIGQPLVIQGTLTVGEKSVLTVAAGSQIKFLPNAQLQVYGKIKALGKSSQHIRITAARSDFADSGKTASDEAWSGLVFRGIRSAAEMTYVDYHYEESEETK